MLLVIAKELWGLGGATFELLETLFVVLDLVVNGFDEWKYGISDGIFNFFDISGKFRFKFG